MGRLDGKVNGPTLVGPYGQHVSRSSDLALTFRCKACWLYHASLLSFYSLSLITCRVRSAPLCTLAQRGSQSYAWLQTRCLRQGLLLQALGTVLRIRVEKAEQRM